MRVVVVKGREKTKEKDEDIVEVPGLQLWSCFFTMRKSGCFTAKACWLSLGLKRVLGFGRNSFFWTDNWTSHFDFSRIVLLLFFLAREFELSVAALGEWRGGGWVGFSFGVWALLLRNGVWVRNLFSFHFVSKPNREMDDGGKPKFVSIGQPSGILLFLWLDVISDSAGHNTAKQNSFNGLRLSSSIAIGKEKVEKMPAKPPAGDEEEWASKLVNAEREHLSKSIYEDGRETVDRQQGWFRGSPSTYEIGYQKDYPRSSLFAKVAGNNHQLIQVGRGQHGEWSFSQDRPTVGPVLPDGEYCTQDRPSVGLILAIGEASTAHNTRKSKSNSCKRELSRKALKEFSSHHSQSHLLRHHPFSTKEIWEGGKMLGATPVSDEAEIMARITAMEEQDNSIWQQQKASTTVKPLGVFPGKLVSLLGKPALTVSPPTLIYRKGKLSAPLPSPFACGVKWKLKTHPIFWRGVPELICYRACSSSGGELIHVMVDHGRRSSCKLPISVIGIGRSYGKSLALQLFGICEVVFRSQKCNAIPLLVNQLLLLLMTNKEHQMEYYCRIISQPDSVKQLDSSDNIALLK
ncbi:hypothetical protein Ancab_014536 [Ancistrocladus abbreviatus]